MRNTKIRGEQHLSPAKISRPSVRGISPRERLFRQLDTCREKPVIWITGPPGSGKTTLAASYLDSRKLPCLWYKVDEGDADISTFFYYLGMAAKKAAPKKRKPLPLLTPEYMLGIGTFTLRYFEDLFSRLNPTRPPLKLRGGAERSKNGFVIVFDNYQTVSAESKFHEIISHGLSVVPENINIMVISRRQPPPQLVGLRAKDKMAGLGWNELSFTIEESREFIRMKWQKELKDEALAIIYEKIKGWAAGLILMMEAATIEGIDHETPGQFTPRQIFDYFAGEIFEKANKETQDFLLKTSFLPSMSEQLAEKLTGLSRAGQILSDMTHNHFFTEKSYHPASSYQYHPLFREFLLSRAKDTYESEEINNIRKNAAILLEEAGQTEDAADLFAEAGEWGELARLIPCHAQPLLEQGRNKVLDTWINRIPEEILNKSPWLLYWLGICRLSFNPAEGRTCLEKAFNIFESSGDDAGTLLSWSGIIDSYLYAMDDFTPLDKWIEWINQRLSGNPHFPSPEIETCVIYGLTVALIWRRPDDPAIRKWTERSLSLAQACPNIGLKMQTYTHLVMYNNYMGDFADNRIITEEAAKIMKSRRLSPLILVMWKAYEAMMYHTNAETSALSLQSVEEGLEIGNKYGVHVMDAMLFGCGVYSSLNMSDMAMAKKYLDRYGGIVRSNQRHPLAGYHFASAWCTLLEENLSVARVHGEKALTLTIELGTPFPDALDHHLMSSILCEAGDYKKAETHISLVLDLVSRTGAKLFQYIGLLIKAELALKQGNEETGLQILQEVMALGRKNGYLMNIFCWRSSAMSLLCTKALEAGIEVEYVQKLIKGLKLIPESPQPPFDKGEQEGILLENWPYPLKIYTLGKFETLKDGKPVSSSRKAQKKPLLILKALIALGGTKVREEQLADILYPESDGDMALSAFKTTLGRLRDLLGIQNAMDFHEGRLTIDHSYCWVDTWAFEGVLRQAEVLWNGNGSKDAIAEAMRLSEKAISLYRGHFLADEEEEPWTVSLRERLKSAFINVISRMGRYCEQAGQWEKAVGYYQRGIQADDLTEEFCRRLMICYQRLGRRSEAIAAYRRCRKTLSAVLGIEPSPETEAIYKSLSSHKR